MPTALTRVTRSTDPPSRQATVANRVDVALGEVEDYIDGLGPQHVVPITVTAGSATRGYCPWPAGYLVAGIDTVSSSELTSAADGATIDVDGVGHAQEVVDGDSVVGTSTTPAALAIETHTAPETDKALVLVLTAGADVEGGADFAAIVRFALPAGA